MTREEIREEISIELEAIQQIVTELLELAEDMRTNNPMYVKRLLPGHSLPSSIMG